MLDRKPFWSLLTTKPVIRKFLEKTWGTKNIDTGLLEYDVETTHQPGAKHAPYYFVSGYLFSKDILNIYQSIKKLFGWFTVHVAILSVTI